MSEPHTLTIRTPPTLSPPSTSATATPSPFTAPPLSFLQGTWHVTYSTLPMWRKNRNVEITYTPLPSSSPSGPRAPTRLDDTVEYYPLGGRGSQKKHVVSGIDTAAGREREGGELGAFDWRGKGWMKLVSSHWEVLGWGYIGEEQDLRAPAAGADDDDDDTAAAAAAAQLDRPEEDRWMITWFGKTIFTPAGIDVYARTKAGHPGWVVERIVEALKGMEDESMRRLGEELFEVVRE